MQFEKDGSCNVPAQNGGGREACRIRYAELGINQYEDVYEGDIQVLYMLCNKHVKAYTKQKDCALPTMYMSRKVDIGKRSNGMIRWARLYVNAHYFTQREAITFGQYDRYPEWSVPIGFGGELSDANVKPFCDAFMEWCDYMEGCKDAE